MLKSQIAKSMLTDNVVVLQARQTTSKFLYATSIRVSACYFSCPAENFGAVFRVNCRFASFSDGLRAQNDIDRFTVVDMLGKSIFF